MRCGGNPVQTGSSYGTAVLLRQSDRAAAVHVESACVRRVPHAGGHPEQKLDPWCVFPWWAELRVQPFPASIVSLFCGKGCEGACMLRSEETGRCCAQPSPNGNLRSHANSPSVLLERSYLWRLR
ncbi:hypothetical protein GOODEAATRI_029067 [Goodea atripinnis]|uniref:Uncharacterized protein n=1 Tax=Goodea atripinnis TaxID=208336 RepID=A0ABV0NPC5_9TELE